MQVLRSDIIILAGPMTEAIPLLHLMIILYFLEYMQVPDICSAITWVLLPRLATASQL